MYLRARYYDPATSQFLTVDPLVDVTGEAYAYASGDPVNLSDPTGAAGLTWKDRILLSGPSLWVEDKLTHGAGKSATSFIVGVGNGATGGLAGSAANAISPGAMCTVDTSSGWYYGGYATSVTTGGGTAAARGAASWGRGGKALLNTAAVDRY